MDYYKSFENHLRYERRVSKNTLIAYLTDLKQFIKFFRESKENFPVEVETSDVRNWLSGLVITGSSAITVNRKISCLKSFFKFLTVRHGFDKDPVRYVKGLKKGKKSPLALKENEVKKLFDFFSDNYAEDFFLFRDFMVIEMLYSLGLRRAELTGLTVDDLDFERHIIKVKGKGNKFRELPLKYELENLLKSYLLVKSQTFVDCDSNFLIVTDKGNRAYDKFIYLLVRKYLDDKVTLSRKSPHILRHSFATHLTDRGAPLAAIRDLLGHSSLASTQVYLHNSTKKLKEVHKNCLPR